MKRNIYLLTGCSAAVVLGVLGIMGFRQTPTATRTATQTGGRPEEIMTLPHGRVLYVVVEKEGVYVGDAMVPITAFEEFLKREGSTLRPNYALVCGTDMARYGDVVKAYGAIRGVFKIPAMIEPVAAVVGTRRGPIEVHEHFWEY